MAAHTDSTATLERPSALNFNLPDLEPSWGPESRGPIADVGRPIEWSNSLKDAIAQGQNTGKPVVVVFEEANCGWCKQFEKEFSKPAATNLANDAIFVRVNPASDVDGRALANSLGVAAYPTTSILNVSKTDVSERTRITGYVTATDFASRFKQENMMLA